MEYEEYAAALKKQDNKFLEIHRSFCEKALEMKPGERGIIANGRVIGPLRHD